MVTTRVPGPDYAADGQRAQLRFYTPFGVTLFGTTRPTGHALVRGFYTPFGVTLLGTSGSSAKKALINTLLFLYALRRDLVWNIRRRPSAHVRGVSIRLRRDLVLDRCTGSVAMKWQFLYALRRDLVWHTHVQISVPDPTSFYTPFGVTLFGTLPHLAGPGSAQLRLVAQVTS